PPKVRVADGTLVARVGGDRVEVEGVFGMRWGIEGLTGRREFGVVSLAVRTWGDAFLTLSGGNQLADPVRGTPEWHFVSLGVRFASDAIDGRVRRSRLGPAAAAQRLLDGRVRLLLNAPASDRS